MESKSNELAKESSLVVVENKLDFEPIKFVKDRERAISNMVSIFSIQSPSGKEYMMKAFILGKLKAMHVSYTVDPMGNILVTKGNIEEGEYYPCIVAHMGTVHDFKKDYKVVHGNLKGKKEEILWSSCLDKATGKIEDCGGCGDDGGGIFVALEALKNLDVIKIAFFVQEEVGCIGSKHVSLDFFKDVGYIIQGDRKGSGDLILDYFYSEVVSKEFKDKCSPLFKNYGFKAANGSFTDVMELAERGVGVCVFNFSVGYYNAHSDDEYTIIDELINSTEFALNLLTYLGKNRFEHKYDKYNYGSKYSNYYGRYDSMYGYGWEDDYSYDNPAYDKVEDEEDICTCSLQDSHLHTIDPECDICNPVWIDKLDSFCIDCGSQLEERAHTINCPLCKKIKLKI